MGYWNGYGMHGGPIGFTWWGWFTPFFALFILWSLFWKGLALWHAARRGERWWFMAILVINTFGVLEICYLFLVAKVKLSRLFGSGHGQ